MQDVKRIEIVVEAAQQSKVERLIKESGIDGYTVLDTVSGSGERGERQGDALSIAFHNVCLVVAASPEETEVFVEKLRPVLKRTGGMCLVSDARWLKH